MLQAYWIISLALFGVLYWLGSRKNLPLWARVMVALIFGSVAGFIFAEHVGATKWIGDVFIRLIKMLVVPLIFTTLVSGIVAMGDPKRLGSLGAKTIFLYLLTTAAAICIGLTLGTIFQPGAGVDVSAAMPGPVVEAASLTERLLNIVPTNPIAAMVNGDVLAIILFSLLFGIGIIMAGDSGKPVGDALDSAASAMLKVAHIVMELAPYGVYALVAYAAGTLGPSALANLAMLAGLVYAGCIAQIVLVHGGLIKFGLRLPAVRFLHCVQLGNAACHNNLRPGKSGHWTHRRLLRIAARRHYQHGRHGDVLRHCGYVRSPGVRHSHWFRRIPAGSAHRHNGLGWRRGHSISLTVSAGNSAVCVWHDRCANGADCRLYPAIRSHTGYGAHRRQRDG